MLEIDQGKGKFATETGLEKLKMNEWEQKWGLFVAYILIENKWIFE